MFYSINMEQNIIMNPFSTLTRYFDLDRWLLSFLDLQQLLNYSSLSRTCNLIVKERNEYLLFLQFQKYDEENFEERNIKIKSTLTTMIFISPFINFNDNYYDKYGNDGILFKKVKPMCDEYKMLVTKNKLAFFSVEEKNKIYDNIVRKYYKKEAHERIQNWAEKNNHQCLFRLLCIKPRKD